MSNSCHLLYQAINLILKDRIDDTANAYGDFVNNKRNLDIVNAYFKGRVCPDDILIEILMMAQHVVFDIYDETSTKIVEDMKKMKKENKL